MAAFQKQTKRNFLTASLLASATIALVLCLTLRSRAIQFLELGTYDARVRLLDAKFVREEDKRKDEYVVIDIDQASFDQLKDKLGKWPWPRQIWTEVIRWVGKGHPKAIGVDIIFGGHETEESDQDLAKNIARAGTVVPAYFFAPVEKFESADPDLENAKLAVLKNEQRTANFGQVMDRKKMVFNVPLPEIAAAARGLGSVNSVPDADGAIRRVALQFIVDGKAYPSMALRVAQVALGTEAMPVRQGNHFEFAGRRYPIDADGRMVLLWRNSDMLLRPGKESGNNKRMPLIQAICSIYPQQCPAYELHRYTPDYFKDKIVFIGASAAGIQDFHPMPLGEQSPGFLAHVNAIQNLIEGEAVTPTPFWVQILIVMAITFAGAGVLMGTQSTWNGIIGGVLAIGLYLGFTIIGFMSSAHQWFPMAAPTLGFVGAFLSTGLIRYQTTGRELRRTRGALNRYMSPQIVDYVLENVNLAGNRGELSILFSDVRSFTTMTEAAEPMELIRTLNEYLAEMTDVIFKYGGVCDKFIGDGILAYWGGITPGDNHAEQAARAGLEMLERLKVLNEGWKAEGRKELAIGIGINTGQVIYGEVGAGRRKEFTVIGDPVNLAARLESQTKDFGVCLIVSEFTAAKLSGDFQLRPLGGVKVKGKTVETKIFELQSVREKAAVSSQ